jgi:hypothetical protein
MKKPDLRSATRDLLLCATLLLGATACGASDDTDPTDPTDEASSSPAPAPLAQQSGGPDPSGTYFAEVTANGTGCPQGTWNTRISRDGLVFTTTFSAYEARVNPGDSIAVRDCQLDIRLHTPSGQSYSVQSFAYTGYAHLEQGVTARQLATYYFQGQPVQTPSGRTELVGPHDADFLFKDDVPITDAVWSPCGLERDLMINTRILLQNGSPQRSGYMNLSAVDGSSALVVKLASRPCDQFGTPPTPVVPPVTPPPVSESITMGQRQVLPIDDFGNGGLLLAQATFLNQRALLQSLSFYVTQTAGKLRLGIYDDTGPNGGPGVKQAETAELTPIVGWNTAAVTRPVTLPMGKYWLTYLPSSNDLHFRRGGDRTGQNTWYPYAYGPLPAVFSRTPTVSSDHWSFYATLTP